MMVLQSGKDLTDLAVIFSLSKVFSAKECGQLSPVYLPSTFLYLYWLVFVFFPRIIQVRLLKKKVLDSRGGSSPLHPLAPSLDFG